MREIKIQIEKESCLERQNREVRANRKKEEEVERNNQREKKKKNS